MPGIEFFFNALTPLNLALAVAGIVAGTVIGALPGLNATMAVAMLVPLTFAMNPASALIALGAIYTGAIYGGSYSAVLLNRPGTPSAITATFDGYPMAQRGDGDLAITIACVASVFGGLVGAFSLLLLAPPLAKFALKLGPVEYFWLAVFGLTLMAAVTEGSMLRGLIGGCIGLLLSTVGTAEVGGDIRYTGDFKSLLGGIDLVSALIGLYCVPVLIDLVATPDPHLELTHEVTRFRFREAAGIAWRNKVSLTRSSIIGTIVGILPGAGGSIASIVAYAGARRTSKTPERYGEGEPNGLLATGSASSATVGGGLVPTLVLGIPGTAPDVVILGALMTQGVRTGPVLFSQQSPIVYTFIYGLAIATALMLPLGLVIGRYAFKFVVSIPKAALVPTLAFLVVIGSYAVNNSPNDTLQMVVLGCIMWGISRFGFTASPIVLGLILGAIAESGFVQGYLIGNARGSALQEFFTRPLSMSIIALVLVTLLYPLLRGRGAIPKEAGA